MMPKFTNASLARFQNLPTPMVLVAVIEIIQKVPGHLQWSVEITDDSGIAVPADFRIYVDGEAARVETRCALDFGRPAEQTDISETHKYSKALTVTIIEV
jgi:hypothetical protein